MASQEALVALERHAAADRKELRAHLYAWAEAAVKRREMSEDIGILKIAWRRKVETSQRLGRLRREYDAAKATLVSDVGEGRAVLEE